MYVLHAYNYDFFTAMFLIIVESKLFHVVQGRKQIVITVNLRAVDRSTIQFWNFLAKEYISIKFPLHKPSENPNVCY